MMGNARPSEHVFADFAAPPPLMPDGITTVVVPFAHPAPRLFPFKRPGRAGEGTGRGVKMRVLAVADELGVLRLIEAGCQEAGMACMGLNSTAESIACLRAYGPGWFAVALLDAAMLFLTGWEYCRVLRQLDPD